jgi:hypothetical protein
MATKAKARKKPAARGKAKRAKPVSAAKSPASKRSKAVKRVAPKRAGRKGATSSSAPRTARASMATRQVPRSERSYAMKPTPAATAEPVVELAVPELAVSSSSVQGEVPAGGE